MFNQIIILFALTISICFAVTNANDPDRPNDELSAVPLADLQETQDCFICQSEQRSSSNVISYESRLSCKCSLTCHEACMTRWLRINPSCPTCRAPVSILLALPSDESLSNEESEALYLEVLTNAITARNVDGVREILSRVAFNSNGPSFADTLMTLAAEENLPSIITILIQAGVTVSRVPNVWIGLNALGAAIDYDSLESYQVLVANGANYEAYGYKSLFEAINASAVRIAKYLIQSGADVSAIYQLGSENTLMAATRQKLSEIVQMLLNAGVDPSQKSSGGWTALHYSNNYESVEDRMPSDTTAIMQMLISHGASLEARTDQVMTPLLLACAGERYENAVFLLENGADVKAVDKHQNGVLHQVSTSTFKGVNVDRLVPVLIQSLENAYGSRQFLDLVNDQQETAIMLAAKRDQYELVKIMIDAGANLKCWKHRYSFKLIYSARICDYVRLHPH